MAAICVTANPAWAKDTTYQYYMVSGGTAAEIARSMDSRGPGGSLNAWGMTYASFAPVHKLKQVSATLCRVETYNLDLNITIKLPKHKNESAIPGSGRSAWRSFTNFLRDHEDQHRQIWQSCRRDLMPKATRTTGRSCSEVEAKLEKLFADMRSDCQKRNAAFDAATRKPLKAQKLFKMAGRD